MTPRSPQDSVFRARTQIDRKGIPGTAHVVPALVVFPVPRLLGAASTGRSPAATEITLAERNDRRRETKRRSGRRFFPLFSFLFVFFGSPLVSCFRFFGLDGRMMIRPYGPPSPAPGGLCGSAGEYFCCNVAFYTTYGLRQTSIRKVRPPAEAVATGCRGERTGLRPAPFFMTVNGCRVKQSQFGRRGHRAVGGRQGTKRAKQTQFRGVGRLDAGASCANKPNRQGVRQYSTVPAFQYSRPEAAVQTKPIGPTRHRKKRLAASLRTRAGAPNKPNSGCRPDWEIGAAGDQTCETNPIPGGEKTRASALWQKDYEGFGRPTTSEKQSQFPAVPGGTGPGRRGPEACTNKPKGQ